MKIDSINGPGATQRGRGRTRAGGASLFSLDEASSELRGAPAGRPAPVSGLDALLALQGVDDPGGRGKRLEHGHDMLDRLDDLKLDLLAGRIPAQKLEQLVDRLRQRPPRHGDRRIEDVLDEIELRAHVELAKLGRAAA